MSKGSLVMFVANSSKMIPATEDIWFVFMGKNSLVKFVALILHPKNGLKFTSETSMVVVFKNLESCLSETIEIYNTHT